MPTSAPIEPVRPHDELRTWFRGIGAQRMTIAGHVTIYRYLMKGLCDRKAASLDRYRTEQGLGDLRSLWIDEGWMVALTAIESDIAFIPVLRDQFSDKGVTRDLGHRLHKRRYILPIN